MAADREAATSPLSCARGRRSNGPPSPLAAHGLAPCSCSPPPRLLRLLRPSAAARLLRWRRPLGPLPLSCFSRSAVVRMSTTRCSPLARFALRLRRLRAHLQITAGTARRWDAARRNHRDCYRAASIERRPNIVWGRAAAAAARSPRCVGRTVALYLHLRGHAVTPPHGQTHSSCTLPPRRPLLIALLLLTALRRLLQRPRSGPSC